MTSCGLREGGEAGNATGDWGHRLAYHHATTQDLHAKISLDTRPIPEVNLAVTYLTKSEEMRSEASSMEELGQNGRRDLARALTVEPEAPSRLDVTRRPEFLYCRADGFAAWQGGTWYGRPANRNSRTFQAFPATGKQMKLAKIHPCKKSWGQLNFWMQIPRLVLDFPGQPFQNNRYPPSQPAVLHHHKFGGRRARAHARLS